MSERTGVLFALRDDPSLVVRAEELGYESAWAAEGQGKTAFGKLERWAVHTDEIGLATGIVNVFSRTPAALAAAAATLDDHSDGRAILGLGVAHPGVVEAFHGVPFDRPLSRLHEYVDLVRRYLRGDADSFDGEFFSPERTSFWDAFEPVREEIPIYNGALGPANVRLTGQVADGWLPNLYPRPQFEEALGWLDTGTARSGRDRSDVDVAMYVLTAVHDDPDEARRAAAEHVAYYLRDVPGYYDRAAEQAGFAGEVEAVRAAPTTEAGARELSADFLDLVALVGAPDDVRGRLGELREMGVDLPVVRAPAGVDREWVARTLEVFAP
ncbi:MULTISPECIES: LLM class flavin-dependent oxidoreductase [Haloferax]|uniref:Phthiodiolone/phenolphthiodiolone dimycocerosates ketoreductase n=1 Tax=Haloferax massiliensis TaxID=1476858 RepID=A0A0D6JWT1_9EURY|nr:MULTISPECIES: LLM class flavin-dependent oxidoreductase [Haloferax]MDS0242386.1 LLM class flavin-dependent oxidoreductase [Haloferax sp. S2CR25]MDS0445507.1 LLM class flavin-dependent oxidoreductase [Haloferax sp. S2CR25-2]CQR53999.1 Phthiodiolone/phenolphthiodiolone dimycocerosates ketoreductase [Haloferax massiliensis]CQR54034.1 Phthiodiolone/phenolphthiodiolone dimycocerosates ketoreductase [Haloferax massiliensis]